MKNAGQKIAEKIQNKARDVAVRNSDFYCRLWIGVEKVPKALLEKEVKEPKAENKNGSPPVLVDGTQENGH